MENGYLSHKSELTSSIALYPICKKPFEKGFKLLDEGKIKEGLEEIHYATELLLVTTQHPYRKLLVNKA